MTEYNQDFTIRGDLRMQAEHWKLPNGDKAAQLLCFADIEWLGAEFLNVLLLKLDIQGSSDTSWDVMDDFAFGFPYMKPVRLFRGYLAQQLDDYLKNLPGGAHRSPSDPRWMGVSQYLSELRAFDETRYLLGRLRNVTQDYGKKIGHPDTTIQDRMAIGEAARALVQLLGVESKTNTPFVIKVI